MVFRALICLSVIFLVAGCTSITGTWELAPGQEPQQVTVATMTLNEDGTYTAKASYGDRKEDMAGTYTYAKGELEFDTKGKKRTYGAEQSGDELMLTHKGNTVKMIRAESE